MSPKHQTASAGAGTGNKNVLPAKEQNLFKSVVRFYETKQLKKALKTADTILKKYQDHGETLAMKGLVLNAYDRKAEATNLVRRGLRNDMKSHICWHVYGLLYRSGRDYREAAKAYLNALRIDPDNQQILRDLALLQVQIRDYDGLEDTRRRLLTVRPNQRNNWIGFAVSHHLLGNHGTAISVLDSYYNTLNQSNETEDAYETSELLLYKNLIMEESGQYKDALAHLDSVSQKIVDPLSVKETKVRLLSLLGEYGDAAKVLSELVDCNPDNEAYQRALYGCLLSADFPSIISHDDAVDDGERTLDATQRRSQRSGIVPIKFSPTSAEHTKRFLALCDDTMAKYPFSRTAGLLALDVMESGSDEEFVRRLDEYVRPFVRKGVPSLFSNVKSLYANRSKADAAGQLFESFLSSLDSTDDKLLPARDDSRTSGSGAQDGNGESSVEGDRRGNDGEPPCTKLWVLHFLAQHYDRMGRREKALEMVDRAIMHTPTAVECYLVKARILKHCGDLKGAVETMNDARNLDLADRYLNTKCCKYALRADMMQEAESWVSLFTRDADSGGVQALYDMQCMWFELEAAESHLRQGELAPALKKLTAVERHFGDMMEDQFDFHSYCVREMTLRAYVRLLRYEDRIRQHEYFFRAMRGMVECLVRLADLSHEEQMGAWNDHGDIAGFTKMSDSQRRKALSKKKKQLARQRTGAGGGKNVGKSGQTDGGKGNAGAGGGCESGKGGGATGESKTKSGNSGWMENDAMGYDLVKELVKDGGEEARQRVLNEARRVVGEMVDHVGERLETHELAFEVSLRQGKYLQALRAARQAGKLDGGDGSAVGLHVRLAHELGKSEVRDRLSELVGKVLQKEGDILGGLSGQEYVEKYVESIGENGEKKLRIGRLKLWMAREKVGDYGNEDSVCQWILRTIEQCSGDGLGEHVVSARFCRWYVRHLRMDGVDGDICEKICKALVCKHARASHL